MVLLASLSSAFAARSTFSFASALSTSLQACIISATHHDMTCTGLHGTYCDSSTYFRLTASNAVTFAYWLRTISSSVSFVSGFSSCTCKHVFVLYVTLLHDDSQDLMHRKGACLVAEGFRRVGLPGRTVKS